MPALDIAELMAPLGPFERPPAIAVAVSGGSDSLGLGLLLAEWVRAQGGNLHVLSVDHGLRPEAADECARVSQIFAAIPGCSAHVLRWQGKKPAQGLQAAARAARYALLTDWCRANGILHLAVAHTAEDQAETVAMRGAHGSGVTGLAGMAAVRPDQGVRVLRPLLSVSRMTIRAWLEARGQSWVEDPSNALTKFERVRVRQELDAGKSERMLTLAHQLGVERDACERDAARLLAEAGQVHDGGYVSLAFAALTEAEPPVQAAILRQLFLAVSGNDYAPSIDDLVLSLTLLGAGSPRAQGLAIAGGERGAGIAKGAAMTLGGCLVQVLRGRFHVFREAAAIGVPVPVGSGWSGPWDNRFSLTVAGGLSPAEGWTIAPLGENGLRQAVARFAVRLKRHAMPLPARLALPALWHGEHLAAQPHLDLGQGLAARPAPRHTVTTCGFTVAPAPPHTIYSSVPC
jgi:tRNA(Ile)-lysidine synthase